MYKSICGAATLALCLVFIASLNPVYAKAKPNKDKPGQGIGKVKHVIIIMQENHSFDNYFGALPYVESGPYHSGPCAPDDNKCVDGLTCTRDELGNYTCSNSNVDANGNIITAFHNTDYCTEPDPDHSWVGSHQQTNFSNPSNTLLPVTPNDGFVLTNALDPENETMGFYNEDDLPFYYALAQNFAISDRFFGSLLGPTFPNRAYLMAATSFGHIGGSETLPPLGGYKPITGTIFDLLDEHGVHWVNYFSSLPQAGIFRLPDTVHFAPITEFFEDAENGTLPPVAFVDPIFTDFLGSSVSGTDEHPPGNIRLGQFFVSQVVHAVPNSPNWQDTVIFILYDEHGGFYDHATPPPAVHPDGIAPGQCADATNPQPGQGANCAESMADAAALCPGFTPGGPYPPECPNFNQMGLRMPFIAVSPFSKPQYVSHINADITSVLAFIEKRFFGDGTDPSLQKYLTQRDRNAHNLLDMFDFKNSPSLNTEIPEAPLPGITECGILP